MSFCFLFVLLAACFGAGSSLALSKTLQRGGSASGFLFNYFLSCFLISLFLNKLPLSLSGFNPQMAALGLIAGLLIVGVMFLLGKSLKNGPAGLSFAFMNCGAIVPPLLMAIIFSKPFGFSLSTANAIGLLLVALGLFYAARSSTIGAQQKSGAWVFFAVMAFLFQGLILSLFQWRCLLFQEDLPSHILLPFSCPPESDIWFMPVLFLCAWIYQTFYFLYSGRRLPTKIECLGGSLGGIANGLSTFFLLRATYVAMPAEKVMLFPIFTVTIIFLCNLIGKLFFKESISWKANALAALGILIGTAF